MGKRARAEGARSISYLLRFCSVSGQPARPVVFSALFASPRVAPRTAVPETALWRRDSLSWLQSRSGGGSPLIRPPNRSNSPRGACRGWVGPLLSPERPRGHPVLGPENAATVRGPSFLEGVLSSQGGCSYAWHGLRRLSARRFGLPRRFRDVPSFFAHLLGDPCSSRQKLPERRAPPRSVPRPRPRRLPWR